jgi:DNA modification methylase
MPDMQRRYWRDARFGLKWGDLLHEDAIAHPAKFNRGPLERLIDLGLTSGWWKAGDLIADPMAGVGCGGVICSTRRLRWWGMDIDPSYVKAGQRTFDRLRERSYFYCLPQPEIVVGDARTDFLVRAMGERPQAVITSPPYAESLHDPGGCRVKIKTGRSHFHNPDDAYGNATGQVGKKKGADYWAAMEGIYRATIRTLKDGGYLCLFVRNYVRKGKLVQFSAQTRKRLLQMGMSGVVHIRASMGAHGSYFRKLNRLKGLPVSDYDHILVFAK